MHRLDGIRFVQQSDQKVVGAEDAGGNGNGAFSASIGTSDSASGIAVQDDGVILRVSDNDVLVV